MLPSSEDAGGVGSVVVEVVEDGLGSVTAVEGDHAVGGMGGRAAEVDAGRGGARGEPVLSHLIRRALALEDVAAGEADPLLDVGRAEHLGELDVRALAVADPHRLR